jgi:hypothetical protein
MGTFLLPQSFSDSKYSHDILMRMRKRVLNDWENDWHVKFALMLMPYVWCVYGNISPLLPQKFFRFSDFKHNHDDLMRMRNDCDCSTRCFIGENVWHVKFFQCSLMFMPFALCVWEHLFSLATKRFSDFKHNHDDLMRLANANALFYRGK